MGEVASPTINLTITCSRGSSSRDGTKEQCKGKVGVQISRENEGRMGHGMPGTG